MLTLFWLFFYSLRSSLRTRAALQAEILTLRHQFLVLQRSAHGHRLRLQPADRIFVGLAVALVDSLAASLADPQAGSVLCQGQECGCIIPLLPESNRPFSLSTLNRSETCEKASRAFCDACQFGSAHRSQN